MRAFDRMQHRGAALARDDVEFDHRRIVAAWTSRGHSERLPATGRNCASASRNTAPVRPQLSVRRRSVAATRVHAAEPQVVGQVVDLGAHHRGDLALQRVARQ